MTVLTFNQVADELGLTVRTLQRLWAVGEGPAVIELSARRRGVLKTDLEAWIASRRRPAPGAKAA